MEQQPQIQKQSVDNKQAIKSSNNSNRQLTIYYIIILLIGISGVLIKFYLVYTTSKYSSFGLYNNLAEAMQIIPYIGLVSAIISAIFLIIALILKSQKKIINYKINIFIIIIIIGILFWLSARWLFTPIAKPIIYLYPQQKQDITVQLDYQGKIIADYPKYDESINGWEVTAYPDGHIINHTDNQEYSYLFWEGESAKPTNWDLSTGFVVKGENTREFLQQTLSKIGLTPKEYNEFIVYWYPKMKDNNYNLIHFADEQYTKTAPLIIIPKPDSMLRVFMVFKPLNKEIKINPQIIQSFERKGFTVVEWGGTEIK